jgi:hypothetical protein
MNPRQVKEYCAVCKKTVTMPVVQEEDDNPDLVWVECPECHEIKPLDLPPPAESGKKNRGQARAFDKDSTKNPESPMMRTYPGANAYELGDTVYHSAWDDTGEVIEKKFSSGGRNMIVVEFKKTGRKKLIL